MCGSCPLATFMPVYPLPVDLGLTRPTTIYHRHLGPIGALLPLVASLPCRAACEGAVAELGLAGRTEERVVEHEHEHERAGVRATSVTDPRSRRALLGPAR